MRRVTPHHTLALRIMLGIVLVNYLAQIPYYLHLYYFPYGASPSPTGTVLLTLTFIWFLAGYFGVVRGWSAAYWLLLAYVVTVAVFYLWNMFTQVTHGYPPFLHVWGEHDPVLFAVFGIGYLNMLAGIYFAYFLIRYRRSLLTPIPSGAGSDGAVSDPHSLAGTPRR